MVVACGEEGSRKGGGAIRERKRGGERKSRSERVNGCV